MPIDIICVVLLAALFHATWNFLVKRSTDPYQGMTSVVGGHIPFGAIAILWSPALSISAWYYVAAGAILHTGYQIFLLNSYRYGDLSKVYPLARGAAPLITAVVSTVLLGEAYDQLQVAALFIITLGIISLTLTPSTSNSENRFKTSILAIVTATFISAYSVVDGVGARIAGTALGFYGYLTIINAIIFSVFVTIIRPGMVRKAVTHELRGTLFSGGISFFAYGLVIWSFTKAPIALVAALRETSVIFALVLGIFILKEKLTWLKLVAIIATLTGVILLRTV